MDLQSRKIEFVQEFLKLQSEEVISKLEKLLKTAQNPTENDGFQPMTAAELNSRIDASMEDSREGRFTEASDLKAKIDSWS